MKKLKSALQDIISLTDDTSHYLRANDELQQSWCSVIKKIYDHTKVEEEKLSLPSSINALTSMHTDGVSPEEIWQQVELQNEPLLASAGGLKAFSAETNLCWFIVSVTGKATEKLQLQTEKEGSDEQIGDNDAEDEGEGDLSESESTEENEEKAESIDEGVETGDGESDQEDQEGSINIEEEDIDEEGFSDLDADTFGDIALEGDDDEEDEEDKEGDKDSAEHGDDEEIHSGDESHLESNVKNSDSEEDIDYFHGDNESDKKSFKKRKSKLDLLKKFEKTDVDSKFLNLRESEWIADNDILGENYDLDDNELIDLMQDVGDEEVGSAAMYSSFFDEPQTENKKGVAREKRRTVNSEPALDAFPCIKKVSFEDNSIGEGIMEGENISKLIGHVMVEGKSRFELERENELKMIEELEDENISEKPWIFKGEVQKEDRPENSTLEEHLDYNVQVRQKPVITDDTTSLLEKMILSRIRSQDFDDVERKIKPYLDPFEFKKKLVLDQEQSKKGLAELYEEDYVKKVDSENSSQSKDILTTAEEADEELPEHKVIQSEMASLFIKLDALTNYHFTPVAKNAELKIVSNLPAITVEESTPVTASDATLLAPQEIVAPLKGDLKGETELTKSDKVSNRRHKKLRQRKIGKIRDEKLKQKSKVKGKDGLMKKNTSIKVVEKAIKKGQIKMLQGDDNTSRSSNKFFEKLQNNLTSQNKKRKIKESKDESFKKQKTSKDFKVSKILL